LRYLRRDTCPTFGPTGDVRAPFGHSIVRIQVCNANGRESEVGMLLMVAIGADREPEIVAERLVPIVRKHEVVVCCPETVAAGLVVRLRGLVPKHTVVAIVVPPGDEPPIAEAALLQGLLEDGTVAVVVLPPVGADRVLAHLAQRLDVDLSTTLDAIADELEPV
jgi:hypothetical protein